LQECGIRPLTADIARRVELDALPAPFDWVVNTVSSNKGGLEDYRQIFLEGLRHVLQWLEASPPQKLVHVSSTSVYGQTDGSLVKETSPAEPTSELGQVLLAAEELLLGATLTQKIPAVILRAAGITAQAGAICFCNTLRTRPASLDAANGSST